MANAVLVGFVDGLGDKLIDMNLDNFKVVLVSAGHTHNPADQFLGSILAGNRVATSGNLATQSWTGGVFDADDIVIPTVAGVVVTQVYVYQDTGVEGTSHLVAHWDTGTGLPLTPNGENVTVRWDAGALKILAITV